MPITLQLSEHSKEPEYNQNSLQGNKKLRPSRMSAILRNVKNVITKSRICRSFIGAPSRMNTAEQRWSPQGRPWPRGRPRGHILKSLALASRPQVLENWPVLGSRTALFFELLKFCGALEKIFGKRFFVEIA